MLQSPVTMMSKMRTWKEISCRFFHIMELQESKSKTVIRFRRAIMSRWTIPDIWMEKLLMVDLLQMLCLMLIRTTMLPIRIPILTASVTEWLDQKLVQKSVQM